MNNLLDNYIRSVMQFRETVIRAFLERNRIEVPENEVDIARINKELEAKGYWLIDAQENDTEGNQLHKLRLVKIIDEQNYSIKKPEVKIT